MLTVTTGALERLNRKLTGKKAADDMALRIERDEGGWRLRLDRSKPDDETFSHQGKKVLLLDESTSEAMTTMTLGVHITQAGPRLKVHRATSLED